MEKKIKVILIKKFEEKSKSNMINLINLHLR